MPIFGVSVNVPGDDKLNYINFGSTVEHGKFWGTLK